MTKEKIVNLDDLQHLYDVFVFDIWGVIIKDDQSCYPNVVDNINKLAQKKPVYLLSNHPRPSYVTENRLNKFGLNIPIENILTSGDLTRKILQTGLQELGLKIDKPIIYHLDQKSNNDILDGMIIDVVNTPQEANILLLTVFTDNKSEINSIYQKLDKCLELNLPAICPNPDLYLGDYRYCAGFFAEYYKNNNGIMYYVGKPYKSMFDYMYSSIKQKTDPSKIILVGDTFHTDILGANNFGIKSALVLTGNAKLITKGKDCTLEEAIDALTEEAKNIQAFPTHFINLS